MGSWWQTREQQGITAGGVATFDRKGGEREGTDAEAVVKRAAAAAAASDEDVEKAIAPLLTKNCNGRNVVIF